MIDVERIDHFVLTVASVKRAASFYKKLGMQEIKEVDGSTSLKFGNHKIHLYQLGKAYVPVARNVFLGSADICFATKIPLQKVINQLKLNHITILDQTTQLLFPKGHITFIYFHDPDGNLIEISNNQGYEYC